MAIDISKHHRFSKILLIAEILYIRITSYFFGNLPKAIFVWYKYHSIKYIFSFSIFLSPFWMNAQVIKYNDFSKYHCSDEAELDCLPCSDTIKIFGVKKVKDISLLFSEWKMIAGYDSVSVLQGLVEDEKKYPAVSPEDFPLFHYTHDITWKVIPEENYRYLLSYDIIKKKDGILEKRDTVMNKAIRVEWETGLGQSNNGNICSELNRQGKSCGFFSTGHEQRDTIWNWPTTGDWVHVEGLWVWDRGHPPAGVEIHPARFVATRRALPEKIKTDTTYKFATRIDIFASGDGGAFNNNRLNQPKFVHPVKMSSKDYVFTVKHTLPKPSPGAVLKYTVKIHKGNSFTPEVKFITNSDDGNITINIPWKASSTNDLAVFAQTCYLYWDEGSGVPKNYPVHTYKIRFNELRFDRFHEFLSYAESRVFADIGGNYFFLNDFIKSKDVMNGGMGRTRRKKWKIDQEFIIYVPEDMQFRVMAQGFEADGMDKFFGHITDNHSPCNSITKKFLNKKLFRTVLGGCLDDPLGNASRLHHAKELIEKNNDFVVFSQGDYHQDECPCGSFSPNNFFSIYYSVEKIK